MVGEPKVDHLDRQPLPGEVPRLEQEVLELQVTVGDALVVQVPHPRHDLPPQRPHGGLREPVLGLVGEDAEDLPALAQVHDEVDVALPEEDFVEADDWRGEGEGGG